MLSSATFSDCGRYRYDLVRRWADGPHALWVMLNPSTAGAALDDPTIRRVVGFTRRWGLPAAVVVNLFALRSTRPRDLLSAEDPVGPRTDAVIGCHLEGAALVVAAWGVHGSHRDRDREVLPRLGGGVHVLGRTVAGYPRHPLRLSGGTTPTPLDASAASGPGAVVAPGAARRVEVTGVRGPAPPRPRYGAPRS